MDFTAWLQDPQIQKIGLWSLLGLGVGVAAKMLLPGQESMGWFRTTAVGLAGSLLGNFLTPRFLDWPHYSAFSWQGIMIGIAGAFLLVVINRIVTRS